MVQGVFERSGSHNMGCGSFLLPLTMYVLGRNGNLVIVDGTYSRGCLTTMISFLFCLAVL
jgi:hypothetical protein